MPTDNILDAVICRLSDFGWLLICHSLLVAYVSFRTFCALIGTMTTYKFNLPVDVLPTILAFMCTTSLLSAFYYNASQENFCCRL